MARTLGWRGRTAALALVALLAGGLALWWPRSAEEPRVAPGSLTSTPRAAAQDGGVLAPDRAAPAARSPARPAPGVFDFAKMTPPASTPREEDRFRTGDRFTEDDLRHPERYFDLAERVPELKRPEERRDVLAYFLAYREKLGRDLADAGEDEAKRAEILVVIERYDAAIARLRELVGGGG